MISRSMKKKQLGQGMTEYIIIVALIAVAAIGAYSYFGKAVQHQVASLAHEISGNNGDAKTATENADKDATEAGKLADKAQDMAKFHDTSKAAATK